MKAGSPPEHQTSCLGSPLTTASLGESGVLLGERAHARETLWGEGEGARERGLGDEGWKGLRGMKAGGKRGLAWVAASSEPTSPPVMAPS